MTATAGRRLSVITPAYNEAENLPRLHARLSPVLAATGMECEWIVVDDHSSDATFAVVSTLAATDACVRGIRLAQRCGSHAAIRCGLLAAHGDAVAVLAGDMQDPPELLLSLLTEWRAGSQVVWGVWRVGPAGHVLDGSRLYYRLLRLAGVHGMPVRGAGTFLIDREIVDRLRLDRGRSVDVMAAIGALGSPFAVVPYARPRRVYGTSGWTARRKLSFALASLAALSPLGIAGRRRDCPIEQATS